MSSVEGLLQIMVDHGEYCYPNLYTQSTEHNCYQNNEEFYTYNEQQHQNQHFHTEDCYCETGKINELNVSHVMNINPNVSIEPKNSKKSQK